ncbi:hypothetical protein PTKIN_Ptkin10aG0178900 [Pterospermum kingtungense]
MLMALANAGDHILTTTYCYEKNTKFINSILSEIGILVTVIDPLNVQLLDTTLTKNKISLFFTESLADPFLRYVDIEKVSKLCHSKGALVCIHGTFATPLTQKALALGADLVLHSVTKLIGDQDDVLTGCVSGSKKLVSRMRNLHHILVDRFYQSEAFRILNGVKAQAKVLRAHPKVRGVYYPGLPSHPDHELAKQQMTGFDGVVTIELLRDLSSTIKFANAFKQLDISPYDSCRVAVLLVIMWDRTRVERCEHGVKDNLVRLTFGVEPFEQVKAKILNTLETI